MNEKEREVMQQHPVATVVARQYDDGTYAGNALDWAGRNCEDDLPVGTKLYTAPPKAEPVESTPFDWPRKACPCRDVQHGECLTAGCKWERDPSLVPQHLRQPPTKAQQAESRNQCGETCERAKLCATCARALDQQAEPVAWMYKAEPWFDGRVWHETYETTMDKTLAYFKDKNARALCFVGVV